MQLRTKSRLAPAHTQDMDATSPRLQAAARTSPRASPRSSEGSDYETGRSPMAQLSLDGGLSAPQPPRKKGVAAAVPQTADAEKKLHREALKKEKKEKKAEKVKAAEKAADAKSATKKLDRQPPQRQPVDHKPNKVAMRTEAQRKVPLFLHLKQYEREGSLSKLCGFSEADAQRVHPSVLSLGLQYADGVIRGADARALAMLQAFIDVVADFKTPLGDSLLRALPKKLGTQFDFLTACRTHSFTMGNAFAVLKQNISKIGVDENEADAKAAIIGSIEDFVRTNIVLASEEIAASGAQLIAEGDVLLTFARSSVVEKVLVHAHNAGKRFHVVVVGARPSREGVELLTRLSGLGMRCRYGQITAISYLLASEVTKVFLGAGALLSNGAVIARAGTAVVAMMAHAARKPVHVFAESYKFSERCLLDSVVYNELGDPDELLLPDAQDGDVTSRDPLIDWRDQSTLKLLNLTYDVTHASFVDVVVTELGNLPPSSVPVIIRERKQTA